MAAAFSDFLAKNTPTLRTRMALILIGLQNEFLSANGRLRADYDSGFFLRIERLVENFRPHIDIIWIRSEYDPDSMNSDNDIDSCDIVISAREQCSDTHLQATGCGSLVDDIGYQLDEELFLHPGNTHEQACLKGSQGAAFVPQVVPLIQPKDMQIVKQQYSAFSDTTLLSTLRCRLITEVYVCGALTNISVYATAIDAARYGIDTTLIEDCLAYRHIERHRTAINQLLEHSVARTLSSERALHLLLHPEDDHRSEIEFSETDNGSEQSNAAYEEVVAGVDALEVDSEASSGEMPLPVVTSTRSRSHVPGTITSNANNKDAAYTWAQSSSLRIADAAKTGSITSHEPIVMKQVPLFGEDKAVESAASSITYDLLTSDLAATAFEQIQHEAHWDRMFHQTGEVPRLVCCQASIAADGSMPVYRHPSDNTILATPWTSTVDQIRQAAEAVVGHGLNHGLIQLYRSGTDFISEHSDKTLDIVPGSCIVNVSLGAQRTMRLRSKRAADLTSTRTIHRVQMPHNSMIAMTLDTNALYLHGINADKRRLAEFSEAESACDGQRISITFRQIGTFLSSDAQLIWGQGAVAKTRSEARPVVCGDLEQSDRLIKAFGAENQSSTMNWRLWYADGFDVLHLR